MDGDITLPSQFMDCWVSCRSPIFEGEGEADYDGDGVWHGMQVPLSCDLAQAVTQLAFLRCYDGVVELPLRKAAALDPDNTARLTGEPGRVGRQVRTCLSVLHPQKHARRLHD